MEILASVLKSGMLPGRVIAIHRTDGSFERGMITYAYSLDNKRGMITYQPPNEQGEQFPISIFTDADHITEVTADEHGTIFITDVKQDRITISYY